MPAIKDDDIAIYPCRPSRRVLRRTFPRHVFLLSTQQQLVSQQRDIVCQSLRPAPHVMLSSHACRCWLHFWLLLCVTRHSHLGTVCVECAADNARAGKMRLSYFVLLGFLPWSVHSSGNHTILTSFMVAINWCLVTKRLSTITTLL